MTTNDIFIGIAIISFGIVILTQKALYNPLYVFFLAYHVFRKLSNDEQIQIAHYALQYCAINIGKTKVIPKVEFRTFEKEPLLNGTHGMYLPQSRSIMINQRLVKNNFSLISTLIHEYIHHAQFASYQNSDYQRILNQGTSYLNHPWEQSARWHSRTFFYPSLLYVLNELNYF